MLLAQPGSAKSGTETVCIGPRAHEVVYDFDGETLEEIENATVSLQPAPELNEFCAVAPHGDKAICVGANVDASCTKAAKDEPLNSVLDCESCFLGATTDLFYTLEVGFFKLKQASVGLRDTHLRGAVEVQGKEAMSRQLLNGTMTLLSADRTAKISFKVAGVIPVDITVGLPTSLSYNLEVHESAQFTAGAAFDLDFGDHSVQWTKDGFSTQNTPMSHKVTPELALENKATAFLGLGLSSSLRVDVDKVLSYHVDVAPTLPVTVSEQDEQVCLDAGAEITVSHEADVHFSLFGKDHDLYHYGPKQLVHEKADHLLHHCVQIPAVVAV